MGMAAVGYTMRYLPESLTTVIMPPSHRATPCVQNDKEGSTACKLVTSTGGSTIAVNISYEYEISNM